MLALFWSLDITAASNSSTTVQYRMMQQVGQRYCAFFPSANQWNVKCFSLITCNMTNYIFHLVSRLEEREAELKKEYNTLHQRHTEVRSSATETSCWFSVCFELFFSEFNQVLIFWISFMRARFRNSYINTVRHTVHEVTVRTTHDYQSSSQRQAWNLITMF